MVSANDENNPENGINAPIKRTNMIPNSSSKFSRLAKAENNKPTIKKDFKSINERVLNLTNRKNIPVNKIDKATTTTTVVDKDCQKKYGVPSRISVPKGPPMIKAIQKSAIKQVSPKSRKRPARTAWELQKLFDDLEATHQKLKTEHDELKGSYDAEKLDWEGVTITKTEKIKFLEEENNKKTIENEEQLSKIKNLSEQVDDKSNQVEKLDKELAQQKVNFNQLSSDKIKLEEIFKINLQLLEKLQYDYKELSFQMDSCEATLKSTLQELATTKEEVEQLKTQVYKCKKQLGKQDLQRRVLYHRMMELKGTLRVACRIRPILSSENERAVCLIDHSPADNSLRISSQSSARETVVGNKGEPSSYSFKFDNFFGVHSTQQSVFEEIEPLVQSALDGFNVCIFAYGQTGSGKTFTMEGNLQIPEQTGMIYRAVHKIFSSMAPMERNGWVYEIYVSFLEIYNDNLRDLLAKCDEKTGKSKQEIKLYQPVKGNDVEASNLTVRKVESPTEVNSLLDIANKNRTVGATKCNINSSRSHSVFQLKLVGTNDILKESCVGKVNLVDLAGSERLKESGAEGIRLEETKHINKSLSTLRKVMQSLGSKSQHIPFRDSKLTHYLQTSLGGNSKSLMFVNISPLEDHYNETLNSLRFATEVNAIEIGVATQNKKKVLL